MNRREQGVIQDGIRILNLFPPDPNWAPFLTQPKNRRRREAVPAEGIDLESGRATPGGDRHCRCQTYPSSQLRCIEFRVSQFSVRTDYFVGALRDFIDRI